MRTCAHAGDWRAVVGECAKVQPIQFAGLPIADDVQARAGLLHQGLPRTLLADLMGAERAHAAVIEMMHKGPGGRRVVGLRDALGALTAPLRHGLTAPGGVLGGGNPAYAVYAARDGRVAVGALEPHFRARLYEALGRTDGSRLADAFLTRTAMEWELWAAERDLPLTAIKDRHGNTDTRTP